jgi:diguanylate cyclase (GGDEF)-like protein
MTFLRSFRGRLTFFFIAIVLVPMGSLSVIVFRLLDDNESAKADARLAARQEVAIRLFESARNTADQLAEDEIGADVELATALRAGDAGEARARAGELVEERSLKRLVILRDGRSFIDVGSPDAVFPARRALVGEGGRSFGTLLVSTTGPRAYATLVEEATDLDVVITRPSGGAPITTLPAAGSASLPTDPGTVSIDGDEYRAASFTAAGFGDDRTRVTVLADRSITTPDEASSRTFAIGLLAAFFVLAFLCALVVGQTLQRQVAGFLAAARRIGSGDFTTTVPTEGRDEFAALGAEFNHMSEQLQRQISALEREQRRLADAMRTIGDTAAANLDRDGLLEIVVRTAVEGVAGAAGASRATVRDDEGRLEQVAVDGDPAGLEDVIRTAEARALETMAPAAVSEGDEHALAHPLRAGPDSTERPGTVAGLVAVARRGEPFAAGDRELFHYLAGQAAVSLENVGLHETVERQATTDELTGLANRRQFQESLASEVERARRFEQPLALVLLDIDNFKSVNDTHGHQTGDAVLSAIGQVLRASSREIDVAARYGGEELALVLPGTDLEGAFNLAERVRAGIAELEIPLPGVDGPLGVTASLGVAEIPATSLDERTLVAAADEALYAAKAAGKNRSECAPAAA